MELTAKIKFPAFHSGSGEMGERIRNFDWTKTSVGDPSQWSQSLKNVISLMLVNRFPMLLWWGKDYVQFYNDPYIPVPGLKHPKALGQPASECWPEIWHVIGPLIDTPFHGGPSTWMDDILLKVNRNNFEEETHFTIAYSPVPDPESSSGIGGVLATVNEITSAVVSNRQMQTLGDLGKKISETLSEDEVYGKLMEALSGNNYDIPFAYIYRVEPKAERVILAGISGFENHPGKVQDKISINIFAAEPSDLELSIRGNEMIESGIEDLDSDLPRGAWDIGPKQVVYLPVQYINKSLPHAILVMGLNPYRKFDANYRNFVQLISDQVSHGIKNALSYDEERKRSKALEDLDKAKTVFFSNISHEFRTPLTLMLGTVEETLDDRGLSSKNADRLRVTHRNALRLLKLVNTLLDFSTIESGRQRANYVLTDISELTRSLASNFRTVIEKAGLLFNVNSEKIAAPVYVDRQMWEKILFNLISNAFKNTFHGTITVDLYSRNDKLILEVIDTGVGISEKELPLMFERFHRVENNVGRSFEGTGIGLSLIKELVSLHGGKINVQSKPGEGSCFTISLPLGKDHLPVGRTSDISEKSGEVLLECFLGEANSLIMPAEDARDLASISPKAGIVPAKILIADDNADMRHHLKSMLEKDYEVWTANNGAEALAKINEEKPALILTDVMMPVMDGLQLLKELKKDRSTVNIPVIILTARAGDDSRAEGFEIGADDYLVKPFSAIELRARIRTQINISKQKHEVEDRLRQFLMQAPVAIAVLDGPDHVYTVANSLYQKLFSKSEQQLLGQSVKDIFQEPANSGIQELLNQVYKTGEPYAQFAYPVSVMVEGKPKQKYFDTILQPIKNDQGEVFAIIAHGADVTEQVIAEVKLKDSEERFRRISDEAPLFVWVTDENLQTTFLNRAGLDYFHLPYGMNFLKLSWKKYIHPKDLDRVLETMKDAAEAFQPYELEMRLKSGTTNEYRWFLDKGVPRFNAGEFQGFIGTCFDIDDQKKFTQKLELRVSERTRELINKNAELQEAEDFLSQLMDSSIEYIAVLDSNWKFVTVNKRFEEVRKMKRKDIIGKDLFEISPLTRDTRQYDCMLRALGGEIVHLQKERAVSIPEIFVDTYFIPWFVKNKPAGIIIMSRDVTGIVKSEEELRLANANLQRINKELESFNYVASHDLQEPLRKIQSFILLLEENIKDNDLRKKYSAKIVESAQRMSELIQNVLGYAKISKTAEEFEETDLNRVLGHALADEELIILEKKAKVVSDHLPVIKASPIQMQQLFSNLIGNSLKFCERMPVIRIKKSIVRSQYMPENFDVKPGETYLQLQFIDNGIGFEDRYKEQIFKLFQRLHNRNEYSGTGVGLSIVSRIVENHHGFIHADAIPGRGSTFSIWLPLNQGESKMDELNSQVEKSL